MPRFLKPEAAVMAQHSNPAGRLRTPKQSSWRVVLIAFTLCVIGFILRWSILSECPYIVSGDTASYELLLKDETLPNIFYHRRPSGYPLVIKAMGHNRARVIFFQRILAGISWLCVAIAFASRLRRSVFKWLAAISIFIFGCSPIIICWDIQLMTESISISVFLFLITVLLLWNSKRRNLWGLLGLILISFYFSMIRASNVYILPALSVYLILLESRAWLTGILSDEWVKHRWQTIIRFLLICLVPVGFLFFHHENKVAERWKSSLINSLNLRIFGKKTAGGKILVHKEHFRYFVDHHKMPAEEAILWIGRKRWEKPQRPTPVYDAWLSERGYDAYLDFMKSHPRYILSQYIRYGRLYSIDGWWMIKQFPEWKSNFEKARINLAFLTQSFFFYTIGLLGYLDFAFVPMIFISIALLIWWFWLQGPGKTTVISGEMIATISILFYFAPLIAFVALFGDANSYWRHSIMGSVSYFLGSIMLTWGILDWLVGQYLVSLIHKIRGCAGQKNRDIKFLS